mgnify:CR=1 FL=1
MPNGLIPNCEDKVIRKMKKEHIMIHLPGEKFNRKVISTNSLLYVAWSLDKMYVQLNGLTDEAVDIRTLPSDLLKAKVICYKIYTDKTFAAVIAGSGYIMWSEVKNK